MSEPKPAQQKAEPKAPEKAEAKPSAPKADIKPQPTKPEVKPPPKKIRERIAALKELVMAIDSFEDLFSDFDPRIYEERELSEDFLREIKRRYRTTGKGHFEVIFHAPKIIHDEKIEKTVIHRIKRHFRSMSKNDLKTIAFLRLRGLFYVLFGTGLLTALTLTAYGKILSALHFELLGVILLPLGWFGIWEGFSKIIEIPYKLDADLKYNERLAKANYQFKFIE